LVLVDQAAGDWLSLDPLCVEVDNRMVGPWWVQPEAAVWAVAVVVGGVLVEHQPQVSFAKE
jgi:hypothetical protein